MEPSREGSKELFKIPDPYLPSLLFPSLYSLNNGLTKNEEQILALERITGFPCQTDNRSTANQFLCSSYHEPATPNHCFSKTQILNKSTSG
ncbi:hypothetical protein LH53_10065 [Mesotoga sp. TolDC]|nr:hypothetical protein LH53_10065 [Mesotoga sp. TolDC]